MRVSLYVRVSKRDQVAFNQEKVLVEYCARGMIENGLLVPMEVIQVYRDEGVSGSKSSRPALDTMMQDMREGKFESIVIWKLDRLGRSLQHLLQILSELDNRGVRLIIATMNMDTKSAAGRLFFQIAAAFAEFEREIIVERTNLGLDRAKSEGIKLGRPKGARDKGRRRRAGYINRWMIKQSPPAKTPVIPVLEEAK